MLGCALTVAAQLMFLGFAGGSRDGMNARFFIHFWPVRGVEDPKGLPDAPLRCSLGSSFRGASIPCKRPGNYFRSRSWVSFA